MYICGINCKKLHYFDIISIHRLTRTYLFAFRTHPCVALVLLDENLVESTSRVFTIWRERQISLKLSLSRENLKLGTVLNREPPEPANEISVAQFVRNAELLTWGSLDPYGTFNV